MKADGKDTANALIDANQDPEFRFQCKHPRIAAGLPEREKDELQRGRPFARIEASLVVCKQRL